MVITHGSLLGQDGLVLHACPDCGLPVPVNEHLTYGRHEDCWVGNAAHDPMSRVPMAVRVYVYNDVHRSGRRIHYSPPQGL